MRLMTTGRCTPGAREEHLAHAAAAQERHQRIPSEASHCAAGLVLSYMVA
jgi:hypothetical protein